MTITKIEEQRITVMKNHVRNYLQDGGNKRGVTVFEGGAIIPKEIVKPERKESNVLDLSKYVRVVPVTEGVGKYPVVKKSDGKLIRVAELEKNPVLGTTIPREVDFEVATYRGEVPVSHEMVDDAAYDVMELIAEVISDQDRNTKNEEVATKFKTATAKPVTGAAGILTFINTEIESAYDVKAYLSKSLYNELDKTKGVDGSPLLSEDNAVASRKRLGTKEVVVIDDVLIGSAVGDLVGFIGDAYEFVTLFDRQQVTVKWIDNSFYAQLLGAYVRFDTQVTDDTAGFYVTYTAE